MINLPVGMVWWKVCSWRKAKLTLNDVLTPPLINIMVAFQSPSLNFLIYSNQVLFIEGHHLFVKNGRPKDMNLFHEEHEIWSQKPLVPANAKGSIGSIVFENFWWTYQIISNFYANFAEKCVVFWKKNYTAGKNWHDRRSWRSWQISSLGINNLNKTSILALAVASSERFHEKIAVLLNFGKFTSPPPPPNLDNVYNFFWTPKRLI